ncbi:MAG TPA: PAS domain S-box protein [Methanocella sp.]|nr:PAS domain S-box protein [Methanocella sp.]
MVNARGGTTGKVQPDYSDRPAYFIDLPSIGWWSLNLATNTVACSALIRRLFGLTSWKRVRSDQFVRCVHPEDRPGVQGVIRGLLKDHRPVYDYRFHVFLPDEQLRCISISAVAVLDATGKPVEIEGIAQDITGFEEMALAARRSDELYRALAEAAEDFIYVIDRDMRVTFVNRAGALCFGMSPADVVGRPIQLLFPPETVEHFARNLQKIFEAGISMTDQHAFRFYDREYWLHVKLTPVRDDDGRVTHVLGISRDITDRKRAEEASERSERKFRAMADSTAAAICIVRDGRIVYANPALETISGYTKDELAGMDAFDLVQPDHAHRLKKLLVMLVTGRTASVRFEFGGVKKDGSIGWIDATAGVIDCNDRGSIIVTGFDVTQRKRAEDALAQAKAQAELYVDLMGHDINNINQVALGYLEVLENKMGPGNERPEVIGQAIEALHRSSRLIRNVRKLQQINAGNHRHERMDLVKVLSDVVGQIAIPRGKRTVIDYQPSEGCYVEADPLLSDVFTNLIDNAIKHTDAPEVKISVDVAPVSVDGKSYCRVTVDDNGPGVPAVLKEVIFDRQLRGSTRAKGSGIGLYLVSRLVSSYRGKVWVEDRVPGDRSQGSRFVVILPAAE